MSEEGDEVYRDDMVDESSKKKYIIIGAVGVVAVALVALLGVALIGDDETIQVVLEEVPEVEIPILEEIEEVAEEAEAPLIVAIPDDGADDEVVTAEETVTDVVIDGDPSNIAELAADLLVDVREEIGLTGPEEPDDSGLTMEDILGREKTDPEEVSQPGADILEKAEEFKKIPSEPIPNGATSGTITWVVTGNIININEVMIHLTGVEAGGVSDRDDLMRECPRDTLALYVLTGGKDSDGNTYGKVWCYGYPPTKPDTTVNNILKSR